MRADQDRDQAGELSRADRDMGPGAAEASQDADAHTDADAGESDGEEEWAEARRLA